MARKAATTAVVEQEHAGLKAALLSIQKGMPAFQRDSVNPHFGSAYLSLETLLPQVLEILNANGVLLTQFPTTVGSDLPVGALRTRLEHVTSGEFVEDTMLLAAGQETPQKQGSAISYAKRYGIMAVLGITADKDDDGNSASRPSAASETPAAVIAPSSGAPVAGFAGAL